MAAIMIDIDQLKDRVYRMLRDIEDGKYAHIQYGEGAGRLSCEKTAAMDEMFEKLMGDAK